MNMENPPFEDVFPKSGLSNVMLVFRSVGDKGKAIETYRNNNSNNKDKDNDQHQRHHRPQQQWQQQTTIKIKTTNHKS